MPAFDGTSLPHRQLRNVPANPVNNTGASLPHRQLRKQGGDNDKWLGTSLPHRQLRKRLNSPSFGA